MAIEHIITGAAGRAAGIFQPVEREGPPIPDGPVLVVANHPNSLLDPLIIFRVAGRPTRPLAKAPLFEQAFIGTLLRGLGGLPVFRPKDDPSLTHRNDETFAAAIAALHAGDAVQIYPEGQSHSEPSMTPLRTGAARIALRAEAERDWTLGLRIVPIGLTYARKTQFRGRTLARVGAPITIAHYRDAYEADPQAAVRALTADIAAALESVTLNFTAQEDADLVDVAERLYSRETGQARWRERDPLRERLPRMQAFARGLAWLRAHDPERHKRLARDVRRYGRYTRLFGAAEGDVPPSYRFWPTLRYVLVETAVLLLGLPLGVIGSILWYPAWIAPKYSLKLIRPGHDAIATYKLATGFVAVPATLLLVFVITARLADLRWAAAAAAIAVALGFVTIAWRERWQRVRADSLLFLRVLTRSRERALLAEQRAALVAEFESIAALLDNASSTAGTREMDAAAQPAYIRG
ncbi:MAG TPA: 1-acyl-sn-glycerol-3-phosphate acyltransferase [Longimicrobiales bacterium]